jgi:hypothetical protein
MNEPFQTKILLKTPLMVQISRNDISKQLKSQWFFGQLSSAVDRGFELRSGQTKDY